MHNAIVKFRKNRDIRNHFAENRANNKDNAPDAAGSPFRIRTRPLPIPAGALGHDSAPPCRKDADAGCALRLQGHTGVHLPDSRKRAVPEDATAEEVGRALFRRKEDAELAAPDGPSGLPILGPASGVPAGVGISILPTLLS